MSGTKTLAEIDALIEELIPLTPENRQDHPVCWLCKANNRYARPPGRSITFLDHMKAKPPKATTALDLCEPCYRWLALGEDVDWNETTWKF